MHHEIRKDKISPGNWRVETISPVDGSVVAIAVFSGLDARRRAEEYAAWKNGLVLAAGALTSILPALGRAV